ncbi:hypothetical protein EJ076_04680 [Mesorhizobium sp. M7D.F.Ca.US.005.01.1.1]|nr:hypothetical protein EJ076_04680 [Mesorhizobium sp. M7D.F.Ca.US.005.01.1.1]
MARTNLSKQLSQAEIDRFLVEAERLHKCIVPSSEQFRTPQGTHEALLKSIREITRQGCPVQRRRPSCPIGTLD